MGELILCNQNMAAFPYYVEEAAIGVYSLEELSYYICHNVYLLRSDFMNEDLCNWLERELKLKDAADALREIVRKGGTLSCCRRAGIVTECRSRRLRSRSRSWNTNPNTSAARSALTAM